MYRLFSFIRRYNTFFLFILLQIFAFLLIFSYNNYHQSAFFSGFQETAGYFQEKYHNVQYYLRLKKVNDSLLAENARLRSMLHSHKYDEKRATKDFDSNHLYSYVFRKAYVINNAIHKRNNYFTINIGSHDGVKKNMAVVSTSSIVGIVRDVSPNFSLVISVLNSDFQLNAKIKELNELGSVSWDGNNTERIVLRDIPSHVKIETGQHVVVGPYSRYFPEDFPIGLIHSFELDESGSFYKVKVRLNTSIKNLSVVQVVDRYDATEQIKLEKGALE